MGVNSPEVKIKRIPNACRMAYELPIAALPRMYGRL